ncbi:MAG: class I SAM-dependent methyltransferase [Chlorobium sp.]|jgi:SAM-dependent methyltransferase|nr:class I SAM-dependent methyltransferase [Chlorobium sp.]
MKNIDWNMIWCDAQKQRQGSRNDNACWNRRAPEFANHAKKTGYASRFIELMNPQPNWSVLDVGCGAGTLAIPLNPLVQQITAIDFSEVMIDLLNQKCREDGITNIDTHILSWEDDWEAAGITEHDVVIASRSLVVEDLQAAIIKLAGKARQKVILSAPVGDGPFDRHIYAAIERDFNRRPDYICVYNLLNQMGILADVTLITNETDKKVYTNIDEAVQKINWMIEDLTDEEEALLRTYFECHLIKQPEGWVLDYQHPVRWAFISWSKS